MSRLNEAIGNLSSALAEYDDAKAAHAATTQTLTEAKKRVDECARNVVNEKDNPQLHLGEKD